MLITVSRRSLLDMEQISQDLGCTPRYRIETLGSLRFRGPDQAVIASDQRYQRRRLALLAVLACAGEKGRTRDQLLLLFWPDSTERKARHSLDQLLYAIRRSVDESLFAGINPVRLDHTIVSSDVTEFERLLESARFADAVSLYHGPFLDGFYLSETREFEEWVDVERQRLGSKYIAALERLAHNAEAENDLAASIRWRQQIVEAEPLSTRHALAFAQTLARAGDHAAAIGFAERYERMARQELGVDNIPDLKRLISAVHPRALTTPVQGRNETTPEVGAIPDKPTAAAKKGVTWQRVAAAALIIVIVMTTALFMSPSRNDLPSAPRSAHSETPTIQTVAGSFPGGTRNLAAYELYLRGRDPVLLRNDSLAEIGLHYFAKATELDPRFAAGYAELSQMYVRLTLSSRSTFVPRSQLRDSAEAAARKAIALDSMLADGHVALGLLSTHAVTNLALGATELRRAIVLNPSVPKAHEYLSIIDMYRGNSTEALAEAHRAVSADPLSPTARATLAQILYVERRCDEALAILDSLQAIKPPLLRVGITRSLCYAVNHKWADAINAVQAEASRGISRAIGVLGLVLAESGNTEEALHQRVRLRALARNNPAALFDVALVSYGLGDIDDTIANLDGAERASALSYEVMGPVFDRLHNDPRFVSIMGRRGIELPSKAVASR